LLLQQFTGHSSNLLAHILLTSSPHLAPSPGSVHGSFKYEYFVRHILFTYSPLRGSLSSQTSFSHPPHTLLLHQDQFTGYYEEDSDDDEEWGSDDNEGYDDDEGNYEDEDNPDTPSRRGLMRFLLGAKNSIKSIHPISN
jgi:hypothetical protein